MGLSFWGPSNDWPIGDSSFPGQTSLRGSSGRPGADRDLGSSLPSLAPELVFSSRLVGNYDRGGRCSSAASPAFATPRRMVSNCRRISSPFLLSSFFLFSAAPNHTLPSQPFALYTHSFTQSLITIYQFLSHCVVDVRARR